MTKAVHALYRLGFWVCTGFFAWSATVQILRHLGILDNLLFSLKIVVLIAVVAAIGFVLTHLGTIIGFIFGTIIAIVWGLFAAVYYGLKGMWKQIFPGEPKESCQQEARWQYQQAESESRAEDSFWGYEQKSEPPPQQKPYVTMPNNFEEACVVLGTQPGLDLESYKRIWRQEALRYHPDKTRELGDRLQTYAEEEMKRINKAWEIIRGTV